MPMEERANRAGAAATQHASQFPLLDHETYNCTISAHARASTLAAPRCMASPCVSPTLAKREPQGGLHVSLDINVNQRHTLTRGAY
jgi:hypothetical protein